jgi:PIN domain nuclease of toxin-antitoxin system
MDESAGVTRVFDSTAMIAFLQAESGADVVATLLSEANAISIAHAVNVCELFYDAYRRTGEDGAQEAVQQIKAAGGAISTLLDDAFRQDVGRLKVNPGRLSSPTASPSPSHAASAPSS